MKTVFLDIKDKVLCQAFTDLFKDFGFGIAGEGRADFVLRDVENKIVVNDEMVFLKPVDVFFLVKELNKNVSASVEGLIFKADKKQILCGQNISSLTEKEVDILSCLMAQKDGVLASDLSVAVFGKADESCLKSLATHVYNLKKKIENVTGKQKNIVLEKARYFLDL